MFKRPKTIVFIVVFLVTALLLSGGVLQAQPRPGRGGPAPGPGAQRIYPLVISGTVTEEGGGGIERAWVEVYDQEFDWINYGSTQADGQYSVSVPAGTYYIRAETEGYRIEFYNNKPYLEWPGSPDPLTISSSDVSGINFTLVQLAADLSQSEDTISPNGDGIQDTTTISYTLLRPGNVTIDIYDTEEWEVVRTLLDNEAQGVGRHSVIWDGTDDAGQVVEDGEWRYYYTVDINDGIGWAYLWDVPNISVDVTRVSEYSAIFTDHDSTPATMAAGSTASFNFGVVNTGTVTWNRSGDNPVYLSYHWYDVQGNLVLWDGLRTILPKNVGPGEGSGTFTIAIQAPSSPGTYTIKYDMVKEEVTWFSWLGSPMLVRQVVVSP